MTYFLGAYSIMTGGWFGATGQSYPTDAVLNDGMFGGDMNVDQISDALSSIRTTLRNNKPIYVNTLGDLEEVVVP